MNVGLVLPLLVVCLGGVSCRGDENKLKACVLKKDVSHSCLSSNFLVERDVAVDVEGKMTSYGYLVSCHLAFPGIS